MRGATTRSSVTIPAGVAQLPGELVLTHPCRGIVLFAHGSGSSRHSPRNTYVAGELQRAGLGTLLLDLLTPAEDRTYATRFDIPLLTSRLLDASAWLAGLPEAAGVPLGLFGASTGAAAALAAAAAPGAQVGAIVSRGGRPDLAGADALARVRAPTLLLVGGLDDQVLALNRRALAAMTCDKSLQVVPGATHLFEEPGTLEQVAAAASAWFSRWLGDSAERR
jgi:dienelactone hydrolase